MLTFKSQFYLNYLFLFHGRSTSAFKVATTDLPKQIKYVCMYVCMYVILNTLFTERPCLNNSKNALNNYSSKQSDDSDLNFIRKLGFKRGLLICSLNAPSLTKHKDEIEVLVRDNKIDIFIINETTLDEKIKDERVSIVGYNLLRRDRNRHGGGVTIFLRETLNFEQRTDIKAENLEIICIEIKPKCSKPFFVLAWYRPPN